MPQLASQPDTDGAGQRSATNRSGAIATLLWLDLLVSLVALALFYALGSPFGAINDWTIGIGGALTGLLVIRLALSMDGAAGLTTALGSSEPSSWSPARHSSSRTQPASCSPVSSRVSASRW